MDSKLPWLLFPPDLPREQSENIRIGAIITDPFRPNQVLTPVNNSVLDAFYPPVEETLQLNRVFTWIANKAAPSFQRRCWERLSCETSVISISSEKYTRCQLEAEVLATKEFSDHPRRTEIAARLANPTVGQYVDAPIRTLLGLWSRETPVYMITGLKYAKGRIFCREEKINATEFRFGQKTVIWTNRNPRPSPVQDWTTDEETLVAYRLLRIEKNHKRKNESDDELILDEVVVEGFEW